MVDTIVNYVIDLFSGLTGLKYGKKLIIFIISMTPILELRGGILAATLLNMKMVPSFIICLIGNIIPIPFILWLITPIFNWLKSKTKLKKLVEKIENMANKKKDQIERLKYWGLLLFVGIPLPGTGAWTGCLIAALLNMDKKKSCIFASLGVLLAGIIMLIVSYGILDKIIH